MMLVQIARLLVQFALAFRFPLLFLGQSLLVYSYSSVSSSEIMAMSAKVTKTVMVTGANGFLASYIVQDLLASGHTVHACVRDLKQEASVQHLEALPGADERLRLFSTGNLAKVADIRAFDAPMLACDAVIHTATPLNVKFSGNYDGEADIFKPALSSTRELLRCVGENKDTVQCLVLTSSMSSVAPRPEPAVKDESHWSDAEGQKERENWYGYTKTKQEQLVRDWVRQNKDNLGTDFCYAAICPTMIIGPLLRRPASEADTVGGTMGILQKWLQGGRSGEIPNDSMSFVHVQDCARMHTHILGIQKAGDINPHQRYMSLIESLHWNDIMEIMKDCHPALPACQPYQGDDILTPTSFNFDNMKSLQVPVRSTRETLQDAIKYLNEIGALSWT